MIRKTFRKTFRIISVIQAYFARLILYFLDLGFVNYYSDMPIFVELRKYTMSIDTENVRYFGVDSLSPFL
jgi:hypothetical protein